MIHTSPITARLQGLVRDHNRELAFEAFGKMLFGVLFLAIIFGAIFLVGWLFARAIAPSLGLQAWHLGAILAAIFLTVAFWSAWHKVNPLAGLKQPSDEELLAAQIAGTATDGPYFNPRHATASIAVILIAGPANILQAVGAWAARLPADSSLLENATLLLTACRATCPVEDVSTPAAALLLRRLALIKFVRKGPSSFLALTEKGLKLHGG